jgi:hypothetical protein
MCHCLSPNFSRLKGNDALAERYHFPYIVHHNVCDFIPRAVQFPFNHFGCENKTAPHKKCWPTPRNLECSISLLTKLFYGHSEHFISANIFNPYTCNQFLFHLISS